MTIVEQKSGGIVATKEMANTLGRVERAVDALGRHDEIRERLVVELATSRAALDRERRKVGRAHSLAVRGWVAAKREQAEATPEGEFFIEPWEVTFGVNAGRVEARVIFTRRRLNDQAAYWEERADQYDNQFAESSSEWMHGERLAAAVDALETPPDLDAEKVPSGHQ